MKWRKMAGGVLLLALICLTATAFAEDIPSDGPTQYTVRYLDWEGKELKTVTIEAGGQLYKPAESLAPERPGYTFVGWSASGSAGSIFSFESSVVSDVTLYATYEPLYSEPDVLPASAVEPTAAVPTVSPAASVKPQEDSIRYSVVETRYGADAPQTVPGNQGEQLAAGVDGRNVSIRVEPHGEIVPGELLSLHGELTGYDNLAYLLQWQYSAENDEWFDIPGAIYLDLTLVLDEQNIDFSWRLVVTILD